MRDKVTVTVLIGLAIALISLGVDLCQSGDYGTGIIIIILGLAILLVYYIFIEPAHLVKVLRS